jgi:hypothetical protein
MRALGESRPNGPALPIWSMSDRKTGPVPLMMEQAIDFLRGMRVTISFFVSLLISLQ